MITAIEAIKIKARSQPAYRFQNLYGMLKDELLYASWQQLNKQSAAGVDGVKPCDYVADLIPNIKRVSSSLKDKSYRVSAIKRVYIPKADGRQRPLGLPTVDDKLVQQAASQILQSIWEADFLCNSYGYRPNKSAHQATLSLQANLQRGKYGYIVEADIKGFFDNMDHAWLVRMLEERIDDKAFISLIKQWLKAKVQEPCGRKVKPKSGTPQGGVISPVLANIYLHYALDIWFEKVVKPRAKGQAMLIRYADDFVVAFQWKDDADAFYGELGARLNKFGLDVAPEKTRLIRFSRFAVGKERRFQFLGFEFYWEIDRLRRPRVRQMTSIKKQKAIMSGLHQWIKQYRSCPLRILMPMFRRKLKGIENYFGVLGNSRSLAQIYKHAVNCLWKWLNRRSQRKSYNWQGMRCMLVFYGVKPLRVSRRYIVLDMYR